VQDSDDSDFDAGEESEEEEEGTIGQTMRGRPVTTGKASASYTPTPLQISLGEPADSDSDDSGSEEELEEESSGEEDVTLVTEADGQALPAPKEKAGGKGKEKKGKKGKKEVEKKWKRDYRLEGEEAAPGEEVEAWEEDLEACWLGEIDPEELVKRKESLVQKEPAPEILMPLLPFQKEWLSWSLEQVHGCRGFGARGRLLLLERVSRVL